MQQFAWKKHPKWFKFESFDPFNLAPGGTMEPRTIIAYALIGVVILIAVGWGIHLQRMRRRARMIARNEWTKRRKA